MAEIKLTVRQILNLNLWDKVCEYKGWNPWILNEGQIDENEIVTFDDTLEKEPKEEIVYEIGNTFERKNYKYEIVSKVQHATEDTFVYMMEVRRFGEEEVEYQVFDHFALASGSYKNTTNPY